MMIRVAVTARTKVVVGVAIEVPRVGIDTLPGIAKLKVVVTLDLTPTPTTIPTATGTAVPTVILV